MEVVPGERELCQFASPLFTFSFGDGFGTPAQHVARAAELGYGAIALTEHGNISSHFQLEKAALAAGIKPIFGVEAYCGPTDLGGECRACGGSGRAPEPLPVIDLDGRELDPDWECQICHGKGQIGGRTQFKHHLTILAANTEGYRNVCRLVTQSYRDFYYHPTVSGAALVAHARGLVVLSGCSGSQLACALLGGKGTPEHIDEPDFDAARDVIERYRAIFGDRYFLEIQPFYELPRSSAMNAAYAVLSQDMGVPLVVTHDVHYPAMKDAEMQAVLHAVHRGKASVDDAMREWNYDVPLTLPATDDELHGRLVRTGVNDRSAWEAIRQSRVIADMCNVTLPKAERLRYPIQEEDLEPWA
jgi:DNA polymerase-3 subunit alpha